MKGSSSFLWATASLVKPSGRLPTRVLMMSSRPENAPPTMNSTLVVSIWMKSWWGCLRPPWGGTEAVVPSRIFSSACCTPSPDTSRVIDGLSDFLHLVDLVDVDDARLGLLHVEVGGLDQLEEDVLHILAHIAGLGERRGVGHGERHVEHLCERLGQVGLAATRGADEEDVRLAELDRVYVCGPARLDRGARLYALVVVVDRDRERLLRAILAYHVLVEEGPDVARLG